MPNNNKNTKKEKGTSLSDFYVFDGEGDNKQLVGILNPDGSGEYLIGGDKGGKKGTILGKGHGRQTLVTDDTTMADIKARAAGTGVFGDQEKYSEGKIKFRYGKREQPYNTTSGYFTNEGDDLYREGMQITGFSDAKGNVYDMGDFKNSTDTERQDIINQVKYKMDNQKTSRARNQLLQQAAQEYLAGKGRFRTISGKGAKGTKISGGKATADKEDTSYESGYGGKNLPLDKFIESKKKEAGKSGKEYKFRTQSDFDQDSLLRALKGVYHFKNYDNKGNAYNKAIPADKYKLSEGEAFGSDAPYVRPTNEPIKKVSNPIKQGFSMTPKDHALGKFSYAAIQAKKAAHKTFPVKKGSMYGSSDKAIYKAKMPAIFKIGVKGLNKLDK